MTHSPSHRVHFSFFHTTSPFLPKSYIPMFFNLFPLRHFPFLKCSISTYYRFLRIVPSTHTNSLFSNDLCSHFPDFLWIARPRRTPFPFSRLFYSNVPMIPILIGICISNQNMHFNFFYFNMTTFTIDTCFHGNWFPLHFVCSVFLFLYFDYKGLSYL